MPRGDTSLASHDYDSYLAGKVKSGSNSARRELEQRKTEKKHAHDSSGVGWHFGIADRPVKIESKDQVRSELAKRGLMLEVDRTTPITLKKGQC